MRFPKAVGVVVMVLILAFPNLSAAADGLAGQDDPGDKDDLAEKRVVVISGVSEANAPGLGYNLLYDGINDGFREAGITPIYQWVALDAVTDEEAKIAAGTAAIAKAREYGPSVIITLSDDALKFVGAGIDDIPVVFAWIFGSPADLGMPKANVTGVLRTSYIADIWKLAKVILPKAETVALMSKKSASMTGIRKLLFQRAPLLKTVSGVAFKEMFLLNTFDEWKSTVENFSYDFIHLTDTSRITKGEKPLTRSETVAWTVMHAGVPVIAASEADVRAGALFSIVTSEKEIGAKAAEVALSIVKGAPLPPRYSQSKKGKLVLNLKTADEKKIEIPDDILSSADVVFK